LARYSKSYRDCLAELKAKFKEEVLHGLPLGTAGNITSSAAAES
jgi:hypothetical protein